MFTDNLIIKGKDLNFTQFFYRKVLTYLSSNVMGEKKHKIKFIIKLYGYKMTNNCTLLSVDLYYRIH